MKTFLPIAISAAMLGVGHNASAVVAMRPGAAASSVGTSTETKPGAAMQSGTIAAVGTNASQVQINGQWFKLMPGTTRVFRQGREVKADALVKGTSLRFTTTADKTTLGMVYLQ